MAGEPTVTEAAGGKETAENDEEDDEVDLNAFMLEELALGGGCSGPYTCELEAGAGEAEPDEDMAEGTVARGRK